MANIYIDESGSMCKNPINRKNNFFFISLVKINKPDVAKRRFKRFVSKNIEELRKCDIENKMFVNGKFTELKGSVMNYTLKVKFAQYMCVDDILEVFLIKVENNEVASTFFHNTARAFNYLLKIALYHYASKQLIKDQSIKLHLDDRNVKAYTIYLLEEYLNIELVTGEHFYDEISAQYYQSENCRFVQIADVFANIHFSSQFNVGYKQILNDLEKSGYIKNRFIFPKKQAESIEKMEVENEK